MCTVYCVYNPVHYVYLCKYVCVCVSEFGLGQLQLCQSELLQMPELPEEEEKGESGEEWAKSGTNGKGGQERDEWGYEGLSCKSRWQSRKAEKTPHWQIPKIQEAFGMSVE